MRRTVVPHEETGRTTALKKSAANQSGAELAHGSGADLQLLQEIPYRVCRPHLHLSLVSLVNCSINTTRGHNNSLELMAV